MRKTAGLFADAEAAEDATEQVVGVEFPSDIVEMPLCGPQFLGDELARSSLDELGEGRLGMLACATERFEMSKARRRRADIRTVVAPEGTIPISGALVYLTRRTPAPNRMLR